MDVTTKTADPKALCSEMMGSMTGGEGKGACPMAAMGKSMAESKGKAWMLLFPGALLMLVGVAVIVWPAILPWLLGGTSVVIGLFAFLMALRLRGFLSKLETSEVDEAATRSDGGAA